MSFALVMSMTVSIELCRSFKLFVANFAFVHDTTLDILIQKYTF